MAIAFVARRPSGRSGTPQEERGASTHAASTSTASGEVSSLGIHGHVLLYPLRRARLVFRTRNSVDTPMKNERVICPSSQSGTRQGNTGEDGPMTSTRAYTECACVSSNARRCSAMSGGCRELGISGPGLPLAPPVERYGATGPSSPAAWPNGRPVATPPEVAIGSGSPSAPRPGAAAGCGYLAMSCRSGWPPAPCSGCCGGSGWRRGERDHRARAPSRAHGGC